MLSMKPIDIGGIKLVIKQWQNSPAMFSPSAEKC